MGAVEAPGTNFASLVSWAEERLDKQDQPTFQLLQALCNGERTARSDVERAEILYLKAQAYGQDECLTAAENCCNEALVKLTVAEDYRILRGEILTYKGYTLFRKAILGDMAVQDRLALLEASKSCLEDAMRELLGQPKLFANAEWRLHWSRYKIKMLDPANPWWRKVWWWAVGVRSA